MALTLNTNVTGAFQRPASNVEGSTVEVFCDLAGDSSYPTGGYPLAPSALGLTEILYFDVSSLGGYIPHYDYVNQKLKLYVVPSTPSNSSLVEVPNATNLSTVTGRVVCIGKGFPTVGLR